MANGNIVPAAAVWMEETPAAGTGRAVHVRTLESSNNYCGGLRSGLPGNSRTWTRSHRFPVPGGPRLHLGSSEHPGRSRSALDLLKQWVGGALFGSVILLGILLSPGEESEVPAPQPLSAEVSPVTPQR